MMTADGLDILLTEDNPGDVRLIEEMLGDTEELLQRVEVGASTANGLQIHNEGRLAASLEWLSETSVDVILLDLGLPDSTGLDTLATMVEATEFVPIVVLTGLRDERMGIEAIQRGAQDYLVKDEVTSDLLVRSIHHAIERNRQEREQVQRREQLEALNTLTRELMDAETPVEVSEYVVEAAEETLALPVTAIALYDDTEGVLEPSGMTDEAAKGINTDSLLDVGNGAGWQAFTKNDVRRISSRLDDGGDSIRPSVTELVVFPLARHGVLVTGSTAPGGFSTTDFDFVETVSGNVKTTLDRVSREQQLHEREQALEEQNRTLERLSRVNEIIRNIAQALVQVSTRQELDAVVCEQLAGVGPYELAWIGEPDVITEEIEPREWAGNEKGYLDSITIRTDDSPEARGPTGKAVKTRKPQVVNDILEDRSFEAWRRDALNRGYHATIALPLLYEDTLYGVLNVYGGQPDIFDNLEQAVLTELADTIAYAFDAVESRKASVSHEVTRLKFAVTDTALEIVQLARDLDCEFAVENLIPRPDGGVRGIFTTRGVPAAAVLEFVTQLPALDLTVLSEYEEDGEPICLFDADLTDESLAATVLEHGGRLHTLRVDDGTATVTIEVADDASVREFVDVFRTKYPDSELVAQWTHEQPRRSPTEMRASLTETLTDRQLEALQTAYFGGFFENPRERTGTDIADWMGISQPTFNHHLRTAQRKLCHELFQGGSLEE
jgi:predicted DNA binding protein/DNA-binding response OmpR family regulator